MRFAGGDASASSGAGREAPTVDENIGGAARRWLATARMPCTVRSFAWCSMRSRSAAVEAK